MKNVDIYSKRDRKNWLDEIFSTVTKICNIYFYNMEGRDIMADASEIYSK